ncbi:hypothetical protein, partial [Hungatella hathewayi]|uniref:hypothetical protein n=3 Tax=Hungatella TaxID=1649459 RepID=UPI0006E29805
MYRKKQGVITAVQDNLEHTYGNNFQVLEPYMLYGDRSAMENLPKMQREHMLQDLEYLQGMYPRHMKRIQEYVMAACDRLDYKNSPLYDEFPDRLMVNQVCDSVCRQILEDGVINGAELGLQNTSEQPGEETAETVEEVEEVEVYEVNSVNTQDADWRMQQVVPQTPTTWGPPSGQRPPQGPPSWGPPPGPQPPRPPQPP